QAMEEKAAAGAPAAGAPVAGADALDGCAAAADFTVAFEALRVSAAIESFGVAVLAAAVLLLAEDFVVTG
ncbi:MAG TPA: hypothetical protein PK177_11555, partial [Burkholderiaceae bacterium]|nr:hypothetical protein [Burkholderiaceae bacterium]